MRAEILNRLENANELNEEVVEQKEWYRIVNEYQNEKSRPISAMKRSVLGEPFMSDNSTPVWRRV
jgi:hypothetical protein